MRTNDDIWLPERDAWGVERLAWEKAQEDAPDEREDGEEPASDEPG